MSRGSRPVRLALALGLASALSAHVVFALEPGDTTDQPPPYRDRIIAAQQLQDLPAEEEDETETEAAELEVASEAPGESTAIASIVDTMLAELRPKLVAEIAKKMSSEKKEKEKKKKK